MPSSGVRLIRDAAGMLLAGVLEQTVQVGEGRLLAIGDADMFLNNVMAVYPSNLTFAENMAEWAMGPQYQVSGHADLADFVGSPEGVPLVIAAYDGGVLSETVVTALDASGNYTAALSGGGTCDLVAKAGTWLAVRCDGVEVTSSTVVDWVFGANGDVNGDNTIGLPDLNAVLLDFGMTGAQPSDVNGDESVDLYDLNIILANFGLFGD